MSQNKPSYGVFMVDIFASSVGIFILVSLLYIIESSKATSNEAMVERFKTLIKRDLVPVDRYSLPVSNDPLHDWGVRARHAREKQEALILLLRDKVLLYHTNQLLDTKQIVDSDIILNYYQKYNKNRRLFIEIHYHDAYHTLKAKISEALPENVHQWVHWAYNAGNINNPNPVSQNASRPNIDMTPNGRFDRTIDPDALGMPSSVGGGASSNGTSATAQGTSNGQSEGQSDGQNQGDSIGQQGEGDGNGQGNGSSSDGQNGEQGSGESSDEDSANQGQDSGLGEGNQLSQEQQAVQQALAQMNTMQDFIEQLMAPMEQPNQPQTQPQSKSEQANNDTKAGNQTNGSASGAGFGSASGGSSSSNSNTSTTNSTNNNTSTGNQNNNQGANQNGGQGNNQANSPAPEQAKEDELAMNSPEQEQLQALNLIRKNVFLKVPLHSPINNFNIDIKVPGFTEQNIHLDAVRLKLHQNASTNSNAMGISLQHGDAIIPITTNQIDLINPVDNRGWLEVKIIKVTGQSKPLKGWIYGLLDGQGIMLPLYENTVQAEGNNNYWYERNNKPLKAFEVIDSESANNNKSSDNESRNSDPSKKEANNE